MTLYNLTNISRAGNPANLMACANDVVGGLIVWGFLLVLFLLAFVKVAKWEGAASGFVQASFVTMIASVLFFAASATLDCALVGAETVVLTVGLLVVSFLVKQLSR